MIVVDTSALMAVLLSEPYATRIAAALQTEERIVISAGTLAEALIVAGRRGVLEDMKRLLEGLGVEVQQLDEQGARAVSDAYAAWGKGLHPAGLNFGDCFAYAAAKASGARLLFVGEDFSQTDVVGAI